MLLTLRSQFASSMSPRATADAVISALSPAAWYRNATDVVSSGGFASIWADYASTAQGLALPGVAGNSATTPDSAAVDFAGDHHLEVVLAQNTFGVNNYFFGQTTSVATNGWRIGIVASDAVRLQWFDGVASRLAESTADWPYGSGVVGHLKVTLDVDNGSGGSDVKFYHKAAAGDAWTQLGATVTGAYTTSVSTSTSVLFVTMENTAGFVRSVKLLNGIDGTTVFDADFSSQAIGTASFTESSSNAATVTINASGAAPAHIGKARDLLQGTATNQPAYSAGVFTFDGADNFMVASTWSQTQPETIVLVGSQVSWTSGDSFCDGTALSTARVLQFTGSPQILLAASATVANNSDLAVGSRGIVGAIFNGASSSLRVNDATKTTGNAGANNMGGFTLSASGTPANYANVTIEEAIVFPSALSDANLSAVITALNNALTVF